MSDLNLATGSFASAYLNIHYNIEETAGWILSNGFERISLQFPDDMLCHSYLICERLKELTSKKIFISVDTTYSNCCIDETSSKHVDADAIIHYGHACFSPVDSKVFYVHPTEPIDIDLVIKSLRDHNNPDEKIVLVYHSKYEHSSEHLIKAIFYIYPHFLIAKLNLNFNQKQIINGRDIIGSDYKIVDVNLSNYTLIYIGKDDQTLFNLAISTKFQKLLMLDLNKHIIKPYSQSIWLRRRRYIIEKIKDASNIGILVCTLSIKNFNSIIQRMRDLIKLNNKRSYVLTVGKPNIAKLSNLYEIDTFVLIACPENDLYSDRTFLQPIAYPYELEMALNQLRNQYSTDYVTNFNDLLKDGKAYCDLMVNPNTDISLITGAMRNNEDLEEDDDEKTDGTVSVSKKEDWALTKSIGDHLSNRTWTGLEQKLGETKIEKAQQGRSGIAGGYENEKS